jgi:hypothetical protein
MIAIDRDIFSEDKIGGYIDEDSSKYVCDFCFTQFSLNREYHYCYYCSIFYCTGCKEQSSKANLKATELSCRDHSVFRPIDSPEELGQLCSSKKSIIVIFQRQSGTPSKIFLDSIAYFSSAFKAVGRGLPEIYTINVSKKSFEKVY